MNETRENGFGGNETPVVWELVKMLLGRWLQIGVVAVLCLVLGVALSYLITPRYAAKATLLPQMDAGNAGLLAAIGSFANIPVSGENNPENLYGVIVKSDRILDRILERQWSYQGEKKDLFAIFGAGDPADPAAQRRLRDTLRNSVVSFDKSKTTGAMQVVAHVPRDPAFAAELANALVEELDSFIEKFRSQKSREKLQYIEDRLTDVTGKLNEYETDLARFKAENRAYADSPALMQVAAEKERNVQAMTAVWIELTKQLEIAQIDVNETRYSIDVLDRAEPALHKTSPKRSVMGLIFAFLGTAAFCLFLVVRHVLGGGAR